MTDRTLTSVRAAPVASARRLHRRTERAAAGRFLVEGPRAVAEAIAAHGDRVDVLEVFVLPDPEGRHRVLIESAVSCGATIHRANERVLARVAETVHPQGIVAVCGMRTPSLDDLLGSDPELVAVLVDVADPGNAGTVIRVADAAGASGVVLAGSAVDPYNGKVVRSSAGSLFHLPVTSDGDTAAVVRRMKSAGVQVLAADGGAALDLDGAERGGRLARRTAWLFGNEAHGLPGDVLEAADGSVRVPIYGAAESLNLATAAAICLYASARALRGR